MIVDDEDTMMPIKDVTANPIGIAKSCDQKASLGLPAKRAKSASFTMSVAKLAIELMHPFTNSHPSALPDLVAGWWTIGPTPPARTMAQMKKAMPAQGTKYAFTVKRCRTLCTGNQMAGSDNSQKMKKEA